MMRKNNKHQSGAKVLLVAPGSIAAELDIVPEDRIISVNGTLPRDIIEYRWLTADEKVEIEVLKSNGEQWILDIEKDFQEPLGLEFTPVTMDEVKGCSNNCIFCFVDQNAPGMRDTVSFKDDDYRLSFLEGNYITLNNISEEECNRIISNRLSPLYVSVHTTNPNLRIKMMGNRKAGQIMRLLRKLTREGIVIHAQLVLCPGWNDDLELDATLADLALLGENLNSVAVVPVGLTGYREGLEPLTCFKNEDARQVINQVHSFQEKIMVERGQRFVYPADEFFLMAKMPIPPDEYYDDYFQLSNGVGLTRLFLDDFSKWVSIASKTKLPQPITITLITAESAQELLKAVAETLKGIFTNLKVRVLVTRSYFFGGKVTVAGLLTGTDILMAMKEMKGENPGDAVIFPRVMLGEEQKIFLDNKSPEDISRLIGTQVLPAEGLLDIERIIKKVAGLEVT